MTMASRMSSGPLSARNGAKAGEIFVSLVIVVDKNMFSIRCILVVVQKSCGGRDNDTPMPYAICHMKNSIWHMKLMRFPLVYSGITNHGEHALVSTQLFLPTEWEDPR